MGTPPPVIPNELGESSAGVLREIRERIRLSLITRDVLRHTKTSAKETADWLFFMSHLAGCLAIGIELKLGEDSRKVATAEKALEAEKTAQEAEKGRMGLAIMELEQQWQRAVRAKTDAQKAVVGAELTLAKVKKVASKAEDVAARALLSEEATRSDLAAAKAEVKALKKAVASKEAVEAPDEDFDSRFFEGYANMKRRVALDHPEWDLSAYSGVSSDFWDVEDE